MSGPFTSNIGSDTAGATVATVALTGISSGNELLAIVVAGGNTPPTLTSVIETTTNTSLTPLAEFTAMKVGGQPQYLGIGVYVLQSPPASPSVTATIGGTAVSVQLFLAESTLTGLALDVSSGIAPLSSTTSEISSRYSNELWIAVESYVDAAGEVGPYYDNWTNGFTEEDFSVSSSNGPSSDWAYLQVSGTDTLDVSATLKPNIGNDYGCLLVALKTSTSVEAPSLTQINGSLFAPTLGTVTTSTTGGTLNDGGTYTYWVTAYNSAGGETEASNSQAVKIGSGSTNSNSMSWSAVPGAAGYNVYLQDVAPGSLFVSYDVGNVTSFTNTAQNETANGIPTAVATIPPVNTAASTLSEGATAVPVAGAAFDSTLTIALQQNGITVEQTVTYGSATSATLNVATSNAAGQHLAYSTGVDDPVYPTTAVATTVSGSTGLPLPVVLTPPAGLIFQTLGTLHPNPAMRISALLDLVAGDQLEAAGDATGTTAPPAGTVLHSDGSFEGSADFYARAYIQADAAWTPWALITVSPAQPGQGFFGGGGV